MMTASFERRFNSIVIFVSFVVVRIGAIAFELTGLEWSLAKFQSLSCFTGTGFTTKEAELITGNPQRRKIASVLMVLGNAGLVILIASFVSSLVPGRDTIISRLSESYLLSISCYILCLCVYDIVLDYVSSCHS